jgi:membrane protein
MREAETHVAVTGSTWKLGGLTKKQLAGRVWHEIGQDNLLGQSAQLAYFFLFAIFPLIIFLTSLIGIIEGPHSPQIRHLIDQLSRAMPSSAGALVTETLRRSLAASGNGKLAFGIAIALFSASSGMSAMMDTLNVVFDAPERKSMLKKRLTAVVLTIAVGILVLAGIFLITLGGKVAGAVANGALYRVWQVVQYPVAFLFLIVAFSLVYRFAPNVEEPKWRLFTPGAVAGLCLWLIASFGMREYLRHFNTYTSDYGTMGAVMVLMLWFYLTGLAFLIGGEIDAIIDRAMDGRTKIGRTGHAAERAPHRAA